jgi:hypothetical protein
VPEKLDPISLWIERVTGAATVAMRTGHRRDHDVSRFQMNCPSVDVVGCREQKPDVIEARIRARGDGFSVQREAVVAVREIDVVRVGSPLDTVAESFDIKLLHHRDITAL